MADVTTIKAALNRNVRGFLDSFAPAWKEMNRRGYLGDSTGAAGESLVIELEGSKAGLWINNANRPDAGGSGNMGEASGSLVDLFMSIKGVDFREAIRELEQWCKSRGWLSGVDPVGDRYRDAGASRRNAERKEVTPRMDWKPIAEDSDQARYLMEDRGIYDFEVLKRYRVGMGDFWFPKAKEKGLSENGVLPGLAFPCFSADGHTLLAVKYLAIVRDKEGKKFVKWSKGAPMHLIGMHAVPDDARVVALCEGEVDMLSSALAGVPAVSVPFGACSDVDLEKEEKQEARNEWINYDWKWLEGVEEFLSLYDNDGPGRGAQEYVMGRLGMARSLFVDWPEDGDDVNEVLAREGADGLREMLKGARGRDPKELKRPKDFEEEVWNEMFPPDGKEPGWETPWTLPFRFRPHEITVWNGYTKHGKTTVMDHVAIHLAQQGCRCVMVSLEWKGWKTLRVLWRMAMGRSKPMALDADNNRVPDRRLFEQGMDWLDDRFFVYDRVGHADVGALLECAEYCVRRYGCTHFFLDSLMQLGLSEDDYSGQAQIMSRLMDFADEFPVHIHLVAHAKKPSDKRPEARFWPDKYQIKGDNTIPGRAHNVVCVYRNLKKENDIADIQNSYAMSGQEKAKKIDELVRIAPDTLWIVQGQRETGDTPVKRLWFDKGGSWQFLESWDQGGRVYVTEAGAQ